MQSVQSPVAPWQAALAASGVPLVYLAYRTGMSPHTVYSYSTGRRTPKAEWVVAAILVAQERWERRHGVRRSVQTVTHLIGRVLFGLTLRSLGGYTRSVAGWLSRRVMSVRMSLTATGGRQGG